VAVVGCDGTGKTRLATDLVKNLRHERPVERRYMGLISGETGDKLKRLPVIGLRLERYLAIRVRRAQDMDKMLPGSATAIIMYLFSVWRVWNLRRLTQRARRGLLIIAERWPQAEVMGFHYDGPGLSVDRAKNAFVRKLALREQKLYAKMGTQCPDLIIRLNIDVDTAYARKPDHPIGELSDKIATMPLIKYNGTTVIEIDSRMPYKQVFDDAMRAIHNAYAPPDPNSQSMAKPIAWVARTAG